MKEKEGTCEICRRSDADDSRLLLQTDYWRVVLSFSQSYPGRLFIPLRRHAQSLSELSDEEWKDFKGIVRRVEAANLATFGEGRPFNWLCMMNDAYKKQPAEPHVHWHMLPRYEHPVDIKGVIFSDSGYGHHYNNDKLTETPPEIVQEITSRLKEIYANQ